MLIGSLIVIPTLLYALSFHTMFASPHPWIAASEWIYRTIPPGSVIAGEYWDDRIPINIIVDDTGFVRGEVYETTTLDPFAEPDDQHKLRELTDTLSEIDYIVIASNRIYGTVARLSERYPLTSAAYRLLFAEEIGFTPVQSFSRYPRLDGYLLIDDPFTRAILPIPPTVPSGINLGYADESFTVYDHPLVLIFRNVDHLSSDDLFERISTEAEQPQIRR